MGSERAGWVTHDPKRLVGRGHPIGDFVDAFAWTVLEREPERLRLRVPLPERLCNDRGVLAGGLAAAYLDFVAIHLFQSARAGDEETGMLVTSNLRVEFFAPVVGPEFDLVAQIVNRTPRSGHVELRYLGADEALCALGHATILRRVQTA